MATGQQNQGQQVSKDKIIADLKKENAELKKENAKVKENFSIPENVTTTKNIFVRSQKVNPPEVEEKKVKAEEEEEK